MSNPISVSDPSLLPLPLELEPQDTSENNNREPYISSLLFEDVDDGVTSRQHDAPVDRKLVKLFAQRTDLSIVEALYLLSVADDQEDGVLFREVRPKFPLKRLKKSRDTTRTDDDIDNFVVDDWDESTINSDLGLYWKHRNEKLAKPFQRRRVAESKWAFNFNAVYSTIIQQTDVEQSNGDEGSGYDFNACIQNIKHILQEPAPLSMPTSPSLYVIILRLLTLLTMDIDLISPTLHPHYMILTSMPENFRIS